jgi:hypothetical protein
MVYDVPMTGAVFKLIDQQDGHVDVEMVTSAGERRVIPDFRDHADAEAWIIQIQRVIAAEHPFGVRVKRS